MTPNDKEFRPRFAIEGHEDEVYHEMRLTPAAETTVVVGAGGLRDEQRLGRQATGPDYWAFLDKSWTFNRAMRWKEAANGTLLCWEAGGTLVLTGETRISDWFSDPSNSIRHVGSDLIFLKNSRRRREAVVLPGLQTNLDQHPTLEIVVSKVTAPWQVCVLVKGRSGPPLLASDWREGPGRVRLDLDKAWRDKGYRSRFAELHIAVGFWTEDIDQPSTMVCAVRLPGQAAIVSCLPVIRASPKSVPISAMVVGADGECLTSGKMQIIARANGRVSALTPHDDFWETTISDLPVGEHHVELEACGEVSLKTSLVLRVTEGRFLTYDAERRSLKRDGNLFGPLSGSYQGMVFIREVGTHQEALVQGQAAWDAWNRTVPPGEHWHYWEALTEAELEERFTYLEQCGWDLLHLTQNWGIWEKLDAGGRIAPHGAEQLALVLRVAARHGLLLLQALSHYPYGRQFTPVFRQYLEAGFNDKDWTHVDSPFTALFHAYLRDFANLFREETALFAMSTSGEGDIAAGPARVNDTYRFMKQHMPNHLFIAEPIHRLFRLPHEHRREWAVFGWTVKLAEGCRTDLPWEPQLAGSRMYWMGEDLPPEIDLSVEFKFLQLGDYIMSEGNWPCPPRYAQFMGHSDTWAGTERYRRRVRDSLYLGLIHRCPIMLTWDEQHTEDERMVLRQVRGQINWAQPFQQAPVAIRVASPNVGGGPWGPDGRRVLGQYESFFSTLPVMTRYLLPEEKDFTSDLTVFDARKPYAEPRLSEEILAQSPLRLSPGYRASYLWSADRRTLLAYIYNSTHHERLEGRRRDLSGSWHRLPRPASLKIAIKHLVDQPLDCQIYSLTSKSSVVHQTIRGSCVFDFAASQDDYLLVITPK